jgi:hypothetical protein
MVIMNSLFADMMEMERETSFALIEGILQETVLNFSSILSYCC